MDIKPEDKKKIIDIISVLIPKAKIYLFGSRARGTHRPSSDIDIALDAGKQILPRHRVGEVRSMFVESHIPQKIDIVDLYLESDEMRKTILEDKIVWK
jgi:predicted nucleotidyltransferase